MYYAYRGPHIFTALFLYRFTFDLNRTIKRETVFKSHKNHFDLWYSYEVMGDFLFWQTERNPKENISISYHIKKHESLISLRLPWPFKNIQIMA